MIFRQLMNLKFKINKHQSTLKTKINLQTQWLKHQFKKNQFKKQQFKKHQFKMHQFKKLMGIDQK